MPDSNNTQLPPRSIAEIKNLTPAQRDAHARLDRLYARLRATPSYLATKPTAPARPALPPDAGLSASAQRAVTIFVKDVVPKVGRAIVIAFEAWSEYRWTEEDVDQDHPPPVLYLISRFDWISGRTALRAMRRGVDSRLLDGIEAVVAEPGFLANVVGALRHAPALEDVPRLQLEHGLALIASRRYPEAVPCLSTGLEASLRAVARRRGVIDDEDRFLVEAHQRTARQIDDVLSYLDLEPRYRRFLFCWIYGEAGSAIRHGDVLDDSDCRMWGLLASVAVIGWLEHFSGNHALIGQFRDRLAALTPPLLNELQPPLLGPTSVADIRRA